MGKPLKMSVIDISEGGIAFNIKLARPKETAPRLIAHPLVVFLPSPVQNKHAAPKGVIVRVSSVGFSEKGEYMIHMRFNKPLSKDYVAFLAKNFKDRNEDELILEMEDS